MNREGHEAHEDEWTVSIVRSGILFALFVFFVVQESGAGRKTRPSIS